MAADVKLSATEARRPGQPPLVLVAAMEGQHVLSAAVVVPPTTTGGAR